MKKLVVGVIGCGNMGGAVLKGLIPHDFLRLLAHDHTRAKVEALNQGLPAENCPRVEWAATAENLAAEADIVILAVKPQQMEAMGEAIAPYLAEDKIVLSLAAAISMANVAEYTGRRCPVVRALPNLPVLAGKGVFALCLDDPRLSDERRTLLRDLFQGLGLVVMLPEARFAAFSSLAGCGPAYVYLLMEGMLNAAVTMGFNAGEAKALTAATVEGAARLALDSSESFADLRARVCSPAGTTIQAVNHLERTGVRGHITDAVLRAFERDAQLTAQAAEKAASGRG